MMPIMAVTDASSERTATVIMSDSFRQSIQAMTRSRTLWLEKNKDAHALTRNGFGAIMRNDVSPELVQLTVKKDRMKIPDSASDTEKALLADKNDEIDAYNKALSIQLEVKLLEMKIRFGAMLSVSLRKNAPMRRKQMQTKHQLKAANVTKVAHSYDGHAMWQELLKLRDAPLRESKMKDHQKQVERLRDARLHDNVSPEE